MRLGGYTSFSFGVHPSRFLGMRVVSNQFMQPELNLIFVFQSFGDQGPPETRMGLKPKLLGTGRKSQNFLEVRVGQIKMVQVVPGNRSQKIVSGRFESFVVFKTG